ncbi:MAG: glycosyltransferase family 39 protein [Pseudomonadota bacterium]|nr:glycosyltransferase family 39 protein [Pseudomonadota bacterium]
MSSQRATPLTIAMIVAVAVATRIVDFTNPVADFDAQFYLMTGRSMLAGQLPYIDLWDRKPPGLFLLYAALAALGGGSILAVNVAATAFAAATALIIHAAARFHAPSRGATLAALAYLLMLPLFGGQSGQSPVFYNLFIAAAGWLLLRALAGPAAPLRKPAFAAMLLCGLALTIKQTSAVEGMFFGLTWLLLMHRRGERPGRLAITATVMVALALLPTALCFAAFAMAHPSAPAALFDASYLSIFRKSGPTAASRADELLYFAVTIGPLALIAALGVARRWSGARPGALFLLGWVLAALAGYAAVPALFVHYALPLLVPLSIAAAPIFDRRWTGPALFALLALFALSRGHITDRAANRQSEAAYAALVRAVDAARYGGCLYVAAGPSMLYASTDACRTTRFLFPSHLTYAAEEGAIGVDQQRELSRVLATRPAVITTQDDERRRQSREARALLAAALDRDYRLILSLGEQRSSTLDTLRLWQRRDLPPPPR